MEDILDKPHQDEVFCRPIKTKYVARVIISKKINGAALIISINSLLIR